MVHGALPRVARSADRGQSYAIYATHQSTSRDTEFALSLDARLDAWRAKKPVGAIELDNALDQYNQARAKKEDEAEETGGTTEK